MLTNLEGGLIKEDDTVVEFGSSTGAFLSKLGGKRKIGVEINLAGRNYARENFGLETVPYPELLQDNSVDFVYSSQVIEHVEAPLQELRILFNKLKPGGTFMIIIRNDGIDTSQVWNGAPDQNNHIYTWNELLLGNLMTAARFQVDKVESLYGAWPSNWEELRAKMTDAEWSKLVVEEGKKRGVVTVILVAKKPKNAKNHIFNFCSNQE